MKKQKKQTKERKLEVMQTEIDELRLRVATLEAMVVVHLSQPFPAATGTGTGTSPWKQWETICQLYR